MNSHDAFRSATTVPECVQSLLLHVAMLLLLCRCQQPVAEQTWSCTLYKKDVRNERKAFPLPAIAWSPVAALTEAGVRHHGSRHQEVLGLGVRVRV